MTTESKTTLVRDDMKSTLQKRLITLACMGIAILLAGMAVSFQYLASALIAKDGFGDGIMYTCRTCNAMVHDVNGVYVPRHWFHIHHRHWLRTGEPGCDHVWRESGGGHADGALHPWYGPLLKGSHILFVCACGMAVTAIFSMISGIFFKGSTGELR